MLPFRAQDAGRLVRMEAHLDDGRWAHMYLSIVDADGAVAGWGATCGKDEFELPPGTRSIRAHIVGGLGIGGGTCWNDEGGPHPSGTITRTFVR